MARADKGATAISLGAERVCNQAFAAVRLVTHPTLIIGSISGPLIVAGFTVGSLSPILAGPEFFIGTPLFLAEEARLHKWK